MVTSLIPFGCALLFGLAYFGLRANFSLNIAVLTVTSRSKGKMMKTSWHQIIKKHTTAVTVVQKSTKPKILVLPKKLNNFERKNI